MGSLTFGPAHLLEITTGRPKHSDTLRPITTETCGPGSNFLCWHCSPDQHGEVCFMLHVLQLPELTANSPQAQLANQHSSLRIAIAIVSDMKENYQTPARTQGRHFGASNCHFGAFRSHAVLAVLADFLKHVVHGSLTTRCKPARESRLMSLAVAVPHYSSPFLLCLTIIDGL